MRQGVPTRAIFWPIPEGRAIPRARFVFTVRSLYREEFICYHYDLCNRCHEIGSKLTERRKGSHYCHEKQGRRANGQFPKWHSSKCIPYPKIWRCPLGPDPVYLSRYSTITCFWDETPNNIVKNGQIGIMSILFTRIVADRRITRPRIELIRITAELLEKLILNHLFLKGLFI